MTENESKMITDFLEITQDYKTKFCKLSHQTNEKRLDQMSIKEMKEYVSNNYLKKDHKINKEFLNDLKTFKVYGTELKAGMDFKQNKFNYFVTIFIAIITTGITLILGSKYITFIQQYLYLVNLVFIIFLFIVYGLIKPKLEETGDSKFNKFKTVEEIVNTLECYRDIKQLEL